MIEEMKGQIPKPATSSSIVVLERGISLNICVLLRHNLKIRILFFFTLFFSFLSRSEFLFFLPCLKMIPSKSQQNILAFFSSTLDFSVTNCINIFQTGEFEGLKLFLQ